VSLRRNTAIAFCERAEWIAIDPERPARTRIGGIEADAAGPNTF
jgi:hypothetical protein